MKERVAKRKKKKERKYEKKKTMTKIDKNTNKNMVGIYNAAETGAVKLV